jgi:GST-like protein
MIDLYTWTTPNGRKISIMLEELGVEYNVHPVNIGENEEFDPEYEKINPNNLIPAIVDRETGIRTSETGAILIYLAEKYGEFMPQDTVKRYEVIEWLMWQMGNQAPNLGQCHHFLHFNKGVSEYAEARFHSSARRLYGELDRRLEGRDYIVDDYSIVDIATWPWVSRYEWQEIDLAEYPQVRAWYQRILARDAVQRGYQVPKNMGEIPAG